MWKSVNLIEIKNLQIHIKTLNEFFKRIGQNKPKNLKYFHLISYKSLKILQNLIKINYLS